MRIKLIKKNYEILIAKYTKIFTVFIILYLSIAVGVVGGGLNMFVVNNNGNKMPVFIDNERQSYSSDTYFTYHSIFEVKYHFLSDRFVLNLDGDRYLSYFSIGDVLITISVISIVICMIMFIYHYLALHKLELSLALFTNIEKTKNFNIDRRR
jgi:hypothetical protein